MRLWITSGQSTTRTDTLPPPTTHPNPLHTRTEATLTDCVPFLSVCVVRAYLTYGAKWFDPIMSHLRAYINDQNTKVSGVVQVQLYKGNITVVSLTSPFSLFNHNLATFNKNASFNQNASSGFIELYTLAMRTAHGLKEEVKHVKPTTQ